MPKRNKNWPGKKLPAKKMVNSGNSLPPNAVCLLPLLSGPRRLTCSLSCILVVGTLYCILFVGHSTRFIVVGHSAVIIALRGLLWFAYIQSALNRSACILVTWSNVLETFSFLRNVSHCDASDIYVDRHFARCPSQWHLDTLWILFLFFFF